VPSCAWDGFAKDRAPLGEAPDDKPGIDEVLLHAAKSAPANIAPRKREMLRMDKKPPNSE
jgi:hypothetical protein